MPGPNSCPSKRDEAEHGSTDFLEPTIETITPDLWLTHDGIGLGPLRADLAETYWRWENSLPVMAGYARQTPESLTERAAGLEAQLEGSADQTRFTIYRHHEDAWTPAMAFSATGIRTPGVTLDDPGCVKKAFPNFHSALADVIRSFTSPTESSGAIGALPR